MSVAECLEFRDQDFLLRALARTVVAWAHRTHPVSTPCRVIIYVISFCLSWTQSTEGTQTPCVCLSVSVSLSLSLSLSLSVYLYLSLFYLSIRFDSILFYSILFYSSIILLFYSILFYSFLFYSILSIHPSIYTSFFARMFFSY